ncbi:MAG: FAD-binding protein [Methylococcales bacterium]|nr:FAD-binding protein [Methylococcales bacterium]
MKTLIAQIKEANVRSQRLSICGMQSKQSCSNQPLSLMDYQGIIHYQPDELVITVKAGTPLNELKCILAENKQMLAFSPPDYGHSTLGGTYACALTGSSQPFKGSLRDYVLGVKIINGLGDVLSFGGELMKNVAGYDVSRLLVGSRGQLAVIAEISLKVLPITTETTYVVDIAENEAIQLMNQWAGSALPLSACAYYQQQFFYRLSRHHSKQPHTVVDEKIWEILNPFKPHLNADQSLWRVTVESTMPAIKNTQAIDWCGRRRWIIANEHPTYQGNKLNASLWQGHADECPPTEPKALTQIKQGLKKVFDPKGVFC